MLMNLAMIEPHDTSTSGTAFVESRDSSIAKSFLIENDWQADTVYAAYAASADLASLGEHFFDDSFRGSE